MSRFFCEPLADANISEAVDLVRASFDADILRHTIYGQRGIEQFIAYSLPREGVIPSREFYVMRDPDDGALVAFADFDVRDPDVAHLAYICVSATYRGQGIASQMIGSFANHRAGFLAMQLDVFSSNLSAVKLYEKLGFAPTGSSYWQSKALPVEADSPREFRFIDLQGALAAYEVFGFAMLDFFTEGDERSRIGMLGERLLRVMSWEAYEDANLLLGMQRSFPDLNEVLLISEKPTDAPVTGIHLESMRMRADMSDLLARYERVVPTAEGIGS